jgi:hypothetical protein
MENILNSLDLICDCPTEQINFLEVLEQLFLKEEISSFKYDESIHIFETIANRVNLADVQMKLKAFYTLYSKNQNIVKITCKRIEFILKLLEKIQYNKELYNKDWNNVLIWNTKFMECKIKKLMLHCKIDHSNKLNINHIISSFHNNLFDISSNKDKIIYKQAKPLFIHIKITSSSLDEPRLIAYNTEEKDRYFLSTCKPTSVFVKNKNELTFFLEKKLILDTFLSYILSITII